MTTTVAKVVIIMNFLWEQDVAKSSDELENGCIPMHCGARMMI